MGVFGFLRRLAAWLRDRSDRKRPERTAGERDVSWRDRLRDRLRRSIPSSDVLTEKGAKHLEVVKNRSEVWLEHGTESAQSLAREAGARIQAIWAPEDSARILEESQLFEPLPGSVGRVSPELLSLEWRNEALLALTAAGVLTLEDEIIYRTDRLFHAGLPTPELSERIFRQKYSELHRWIDTVPGSATAGGGITHRVKHGHDLEAAAAIYEKHGLEGVLVWTQHVGQDVFSSTGIPVPAGGRKVAGFLVDKGYASPGNAALLVSFNAAELAAAFLAGTFAVRLATLLMEMKRRRQVKKRCAAAFRAWQRDDLDAVIDHYSEARSLSNDPALSLALGWVYRETDRPAAESFLEFRRAALELASEDRMIDLNGVTVSLRGLAYLLALIEAPQVLQRSDLAGAWRGELDRMVRGAVASFEVAALSQAQRPSLEIRQQSYEWRPRPLSAAANYYLAARSVAAVPFEGKAGGIRRLRANSLEILRQVEENSGEADKTRIVAVATRWETVLADDVGLIPG